MYCLMDAPGWVCHTSGGSPPSRRLARTTCALLPPPPATAALRTATPGWAVRKSSKSTLSAARSDPDVHRDSTSRFRVGPLVAVEAGPPQPASRSARPAARAARPQRRLRVTVDSPRDGGIASGMSRHRLRRAVLERLCRLEVVERVGHH